MDLEESMDLEECIPARTEELPKGYVEKTEGTVGPNDLVWNSAENAFLSAENSGTSAVGESVDDFERIGTPAYWITFNGTTGVVWGVGETPEESLRTAKFEAFGDDHNAVGYEFACWCEEMSTTACSAALYEEAREGGRLSISDNGLEDHVVTT
jgi:hypothetical protein